MTPCLKREQPAAVCPCTDCATAVPVPMPEDMRGCYRERPGRRGTLLGMSFALVLAGCTVEGSSCTTPDGCPTGWACTVGKCERPDGGR